MVRDIGIVHMGTIAKIDRKGYKANCNKLDGVPGKLKGTIAATTPRGTRCSSHVMPLETCLNMVYIEFN